MDFDRRAIHPATRRASERLIDACETRTQYDAIVQRFGSSSERGFAWRPVRDGIWVRQLGHEFIVNSSGAVRHAD